MDGKVMSGVAAVARTGRPFSSSSSPSARSASSKKLRVFAARVATSR